MRVEDVFERQVGVVGRRTLVERALDIIQRVLEVTNQRATRYRQLKIALFGWQR